jgi:ABC-type multidrug transport system fused ATPase/permease subunit
MMIYNKVLVRKVIISQDKEKGTANGSGNLNGANGVAGSAEASQNTGGSADKNASKPKWRLIRQLLTGKKDVDSKPKGPASTGQVVNLVQSDAYDIAKQFSGVQRIIKTPIGLIFNTYLIWWLLGPSCFLAVAAFIIGHLINILLSRIQVKWRRIQKKATDERIHQSSQFIGLLKYLRYIGWHEQWHETVKAARGHELNVRLISIGLSMATYFTSVFVSQTFPVIAFFAYTALAGHELRIDLIFPALQLFAKLQSHMRSVPRLISSYLNVTVSIERLDHFLNEDERGNISTSAANPEIPPVLKLKDCIFASPDTGESILRNVTLTIEVGLTVVYGLVGSGKTSLLRALLGEMDLIDGKVEIPNKRVGYCAQTPWLQSVSIRENILFHTPYDEERYLAVLDACALLPDLNGFKDGDQLHIGEK